MPSSASNRVQNRSLNRNFMPLRDEKKLLVNIQSNIEGMNIPKI